jgi:hypothetical protein
MVNGDKRKPATAALAMNIETLPLKIKKTQPRGPK